MNRKITEAQTTALLAEHGDGNVLTLNVGEDQYAFRRYTRAAALAMLKRQEEGRHDWLEFAAQSALLCPLAPRTGKRAGEDAALPESERAAMTVERARYAELLNGGAALGMVIGMTLAQVAGFRAKVDVDISSGEYIVKCWLSVSPDDEVDDDALVDGETDAPPDLTIKMRKLTRPEFRQYRDRIGAIESAMLTLGDGSAKSVFDLACIDQQAATIAADYPLLAHQLANLALGFGCEDKAVSLKKSPALTTKPPTNSPTAPTAT